VVKKYFIFLLFLSVTSLYGNTLVIDKVKSFLDPSVYAHNRSFINIIFMDESKFLSHDKVDAVKIIATLKQNGLLKLFFTKPKEITITFNANAPSLFFTKIMFDTLRSMGYYRFITKEAKMDDGGFFWTISMESEYVTDPILLSHALEKRGCKISDIKRSSASQWFYSIDMHNAHLKSKIIHDGEVISLRRAQNSEWWVNISAIKKLKITSNRGNIWYPSIAFYSKELQLLKVYKRDKKTYQIAVKLPKDSFYIKISDIYTLKNLKNGLKLEAQGER